MAISEIIKDIVLIANGIDARGDHDSAGILDKVSSDLSMVKQAQYLGVQGTAVRNSRCWQGCVRQKRASGKTPADAWSSCHEEWLEAISGKTEKWSKYASNRRWHPEPMGGDTGLNSVIMEKIASGQSFDHAIAESVAEHVMAIPDRIVSCANSLAKIATKIQEKDPSVAGRLRVNASLLRDEAWEMTKNSLPDED